MLNILVIGGAGYIGSVVVKQLLEKKFNVSVLDNLSKGVRELVPNSASFFEGDILDESFLHSVFASKKFDAVIHFAAAKDAGESMVNLEKYSKNIIGTINILNKMVEFDVKKIIFSSSAAVYGAPIEDVIDESHALEPLNFYGFSKLESERLLHWYHMQKGINFAALRYFNVAGDVLGYVDPDARNIFPIICEVLAGKRESLKVYGDDYDTKDGTGIRDYIHVADLADAHIKAIKLSGAHIINLGSSNGFSVLDLVKEFEKVSGKKINYSVVDRRAGDPASLVASNKRAKELLDWSPMHDLNSMVKSSWLAYRK
jgi:UDP-glucose 4-epimerase